MSEIRVSEGTAAVLGLKALRSDVPPRTAYLMIGERCLRDCAFCAQARNASGPAGHLSRVTWPAYPQDEVVRRLAVAAGRGELERVCVQTVAGPDSLPALAALLPVLNGEVRLPVSASVYVRDLPELDLLLGSGLERVGIAIDAATPATYRAAKNGEQAQALTFLARAATAYPGRVTTHLIVGLGESEQEAITFLAWCVELGVACGLFAFTPVRGTRMAETVPPPLSSYRRIQAAAALLRNGAAQLDDFAFTERGELTAIGLPRDVVLAALADGSAFETRGCPGCNRPYYNERPGHVPYNYPRRLTGAELQAALLPVIAVVQPAQAAVANKSGESR